MRLIKEMYHKDPLPIEGKAIYREAVRGIILKGDSLLMIFSPQNGDYKFPGGGVNAGETHEKALLREIQEECGALLRHIEKEFGKIIEYDIPLEKDYDVFKMTSYYYLCKVKENFSDQNLDPYEEKLGFKPVWIDVETAIENNKSIINSCSQEKARWIIRDTLILKEIKIMKKEA